MKDWMKERSTKSLISDRTQCIEELKTFESIEEHLQPGEKINEKSRWSITQHLINIERELIRRGEQITPTRFTATHFPSEEDTNA